MSATLSALAEKDLTTLQSDLAAATRIAKAARPPDIEAITCFSALSAHVAELNRLKRTNAEPNGSVSSLEASRVKSRGIDRLASPAASARIDGKCGPFYMGVENGLGGLLSALNVQQ